MEKIEKFNGKHFILAFAASMVVFSIVSMSGFYFFVKSIFYQSVFEELIRFVFLLFFFRTFNSLIFSAISYAMGEMFFVTVVNYILFRPDYLIPISLGSAIAYSSIFCTFLIGVSAGLLYHENLKMGHRMFWGIFLMVSLKYSMRWFPESSFSDKSNSYVDLVFYAAFALYITMIIILMIRRNSQNCNDSVPR